jgi:glycosyltransferase involved in cell wall biosynthesis
MAHRPPVTVTIIARNEESKLARTIASVRWAEEVLVVDSGSTDRTAQIAAEMGARVLHNPWQGYGQQKNYAQQHAKNDWVLNLDADEAVSPELALELQQALEDVASAKSAVYGFSIPRRNYYLGRWIRHGGWYPNYLTRLSDRRHSRWSEPPVHEALEVSGEVRALSNPLDHFSFESIHDQVATNLNFSRLGSEQLLLRGKKPSLIKILIKPPGKFIETYFVKRGFLDGLAGFIISVNAAYSIFLKYAYLLEGRIRQDADSRHRQ